MPLLGSPFLPGNAAEVIDKIEDQELAEIAQAELYYFSAQPEKSAEIVEKYLKSEDMILRMSADVLYTFTNMMNEDIAKIQQAQEDIQICLEKILQDDSDVEMQAFGLLALYIVSILLHIPPNKELPSLKSYLQYLPKGQRLFAMHMMAHSAYLQQEYAVGQGIAQAGQSIVDELYPIPYVYLKCVEAMCQINRKNKEDALDSVMEAWKIARKDKLLEPFIEYHSLLQGVADVWINQQEPEV